MNLDAMADALEARAAMAIKAEEGDYIGEDGLLYCHKCNTRKQTEINFLGRIRRPPCMCKCMAAKRAAEEEEYRRREFEERVKELRRVGFPEADMRNWTFANDDLTNEKITKAAQRYVDNFHELRKSGKGLLLYGNTGTGKTFTACEIANALIDKGYPVLVTNFARILNTLQGTFEKQDYIDNFNGYQLLVIDDLGIERDTAYAKEQVFNIIDSRYRSGLPMIITTNLTMEKIKNPEDIENRRIYDRILERCFPIEVSGSSRRRKAVREDYEDMKNLLGLE
jgi:DNA replication protein DnaC